MFQPFYRAEASRRRGSEPHLGLGLYIVNSHLKVLGGTCRVESKVGEGTVVHVEIPRRETRQPTAPEESLRSVENVSARSVVLEREGSGR